MLQLEDYRLPVEKDVLEDVLLALVILALEVVLILLL
jgi:hypothetical protein